MGQQAVNERGAGTGRGRGVRGKFRRHAAMASAAALSLGGLLLGLEGSASAAPLLPPGSHGLTLTGTTVGVYSSPSDDSPKVGVPDMAPGDGVAYTCWTRGQDIHNHGNVWYRVTEEAYASIPNLVLFVNGWIYGAYADGNATFHRGAVAAC
jgi:hypothetical protein